MTFYKYLISSNADIQILIGIFGVGALFKGYLAVAILLLAAYLVMQFKRTRNVLHSEG